MHIPRLLTLLIAVIALAVVVLAGMQVVQPARPLIASAAFEHAQITPNADGDSDVTTLRYTLTRNATVTLTFADSAGREFVFREAQPRIAGDYRVQFSGVVRGYTLPGEEIQGQVEARLLPNGEYTWTLSAVGEDGVAEQASGTLIVADANPILPDLTALTISPTAFSPNQDGVADRVMLYTYLAAEANLTMYLEGADGTRIYVAEYNMGVLAGAAGPHWFDYDGGIDAGLEPPDDGDYTVVLRAEDAEGQRVSRTGTLSLRNGGTPIGAIYPQPTGTTVFYGSMPYEDRYYTDAETAGALIPMPEGVQAEISSLSIVQGDLLVFRLIVVNDGTVGMRTTGPYPGTVYQQDQAGQFPRWYDESGAWRVGLDCDTATSDYPWRWAIGTPDDLETAEEDGTTYRYLPPGAQAVVWGAVRLTDIVPSRNPQYCWVGLIHEDVEVRDARIDARQIEIMPGPETE